MAEGKRILMINTVPTAENGVTGVILHMMEALAACGASVDLLSQNEPSEVIRRRIEGMGGRLLLARARRSRILGYVRELKVLCRGYDVVHAHGNSGTLALEMYGAARAGVPIRVAHSHSSFCRYRRMDRLLRPLLYAKVTHRAACGRDAGRWLWGDRRFTVLPNCISLDRYRFDSEAAGGIREKFPENAILLGQIGTIDENKNQIFSLERLASLLVRDDRFYLLFVGEGELAGEVRARAESLGCTSHVFLLGRRGDVPALLSAFDALLLPSHFEGLPLTLLEGQASGLPCIVSESVTRELDVSGISYLPLSDPRAWEEALLRIVRGGDAERAEASRAGCAALAAAGYAQSGLGTRLCEFYTSLE